MTIKPTKNPGEVTMEVGQNDEALLAAGTTAPFQVKRILVPIDFSSCSRKALQYALPLARQHGAELKVLFVVSTPAYVTSEYGLMDYAAVEASMREAAGERLSVFIGDEIRGSVPAEAAVRSGSPTGEIIETASSWPADMIVISTHGNTGLRHILLGSVAEHVVRHAPCPVLVVREHEHECLKE